MAIITHRGKLTLLRVHDVGTGFGPQSDFLDGEVVVKLDSRPDLAFGFQLREDANRAVRTGMLGLLRDAYNNKFTVSMDVDLADGRKQGRIFRVWLEGQQGGDDAGGHEGPQFPRDVIAR